MTAVVTEDETGAVVRRFVERVWDAGDADALADLTTEDFALHQLVAGEDHDRAGFEAFLAQTHDAMPDFSMTIEALVVDGEDAVARLEMGGTPEKPLQAVQPTGRSFRVTAFQQYRVEDGRVAEVWVMVDAVGTLRQLGVFPPGPRLMLRVAAGKLRARLFGG